VCQYNTGTKFASICRRVSSLEHARASPGLVSCRPGDFQACFEWNARPHCRPARNLRASNDRYRSRGFSRGCTHATPLASPGWGICILDSSSHRKSRTDIAAAHNPAATIAAPRAGKIIQKRFRLLMMVSLARPLKIRPLQLLCDRTRSGSSLRCGRNWCLLLVFINGNQKTKNHDRNRPWHCGSWLNHRRVDCRAALGDRDIVAWMGSAAQTRRAICRTYTVRQLPSQSAS
jgi:hypothetical protein